MKQGFIKVAASAIDLKVADVAHNLACLCQQLQEARVLGASLLVFPSLTLTGATCGDLFHHDALLDAATEALSLLTEATRGSDTVCVVGTPLRFRGQIYSTAAVLQNGRLLGIVPHLPQASDSRFFADPSALPDDATLELCGQCVPFGRKLVFEGNAVSFGVLLEQEAFLPCSPADALAAEGALFLVNPSACPAYMDGGEARRAQILALSERLHCGVISVSAAATESTQDLVMGDHHLIAENGTLLAEHPAFACPSLTVTELDAGLLTAERSRQGFPTHASFRRIPFVQEEQLTTLTRSFDRNPFLPADIDRDAYAERILTIQAHGLRKRLTHTFAKTAVLGISGGLDSTLALLATVRAFDLMGKDRHDIRAFTLPCFGTSDRTKNNALLLCEALGVSLEEIPIGDAVLQHFRDIGHDPQVTDVTFENSQARERTQVLMDLANRYHGMVIGTGDMSELALGWATYNGDHMSMYGLNASIPKTMVRAVVGYEAKRLGKPIDAILSDIIDTPVSPELLPTNTEGTIAQKTEDLVGPYELHDFFLYHFLRYGFTPAKLYRMAVLAFDGVYDKQTVLHWLSVFLRRFFVSQFKRSALPDGPSVSPLSLSPRGGWLMPSDASFALYRHELEVLAAKEGLTL